MTSASAIDIHSHVVPQTYPPYAGSGTGARWPQMTEPCCGRSNVVIDGKVFRTVTDECWDIGRRIEAMQRAGIGRQVLSPMPELFSYWLDKTDALALGRYVNDVIGALVETARDRFLGLGTVPLQDPGLAARELERIMRDGRFRGVEIGTNVNGAVIGDPRFEELFAAAEELDAAIFVHALHPVGRDRVLGPPKLVNYVAFPCETAFAIASLMTGGILQRHPRLRLAFSHGGGAFALVLPRLEHGWRLLPELAEAMGASPREQARRLYYDTLVYDPQTLRFLVDAFGATQLCIGTDFPFDIQDRDPLASVARAGLDGEAERLLRTANAERFLGLA
jgi:aminocarboxymuconate-semialdehyde decarboxylase